MHLKKYLISCIIRFCKSSLVTKIIFILKFLGAWEGFWSKWMRSLKFSRLLTIDIQNKTTIPKHNQCDMWYAMLNSKYNNL